MLKSPLIAVLLSWLISSPVQAASDGSEVMRTVKQVVWAFNRGDTATFIAACAAETSIVDEIPPHEWHGKDACAKWLKDYGAFVESRKIENAVTMLGAMHRIELSGDNAYVVVSATCDYKQTGEAVHEDVTITLSLHKYEERWLLTGWVWSRL